MEHLAGDIQENIVIWEDYKSLFSHRARVHSLHWSVFLKICIQEISTCHADEVYFALKKKYIFKSLTSFEIEFKQSTFLMICIATLKMPDTSFDWIVTSYYDIFTCERENMLNTINHVF